MQSLVSFRLHSPLRPPTRASPLPIHARPRETPEHRSRWSPRWCSMLHPAPRINPITMAHGQKAGNDSTSTITSESEWCGQGLAVGFIAVAICPIRHGNIPVFNFCGPHVHPSLHSKPKAQQVQDCGTQWTKGMPLAARIYGRPTLAHAIAMA